MRSTAWTKMTKTCFNLPRVSSENNKLHQGSFMRRLIKIAYAQIVAYFRPLRLVWSKRKVIAKCSWGVVYACNFRTLHARIRNGLRGLWVCLNLTLRQPVRCWWSAVLGAKLVSTSCMGYYYVLNTYNTYNTCPILYIHVMYFTYNTQHTHTRLNKARYSYTQLYRAIQRYTQGYTKV